MLSSAAAIVLLSGFLVFAMVITVFYGVLKLRRMQEEYARRCPAKESK